MLDKAERFKILKLIRNCCFIGCFPATIDLSSWQLLQHSGRKTWLCFAYYGLLVLHTFYKVVTLCDACITEIGTPLYQLIIHAVLAFSGLLITFWYYQLFVEHPGALGRYLHMTLTGNIGRMTIDIGEKTNGVSRWKAYTPQDMVIISLPYMFAFAVVAIIGNAFYCPTLSLLLYAGLPKQFQTWLSFKILGLEELRFLLMLCAVASVILTLQIVSFDLLGGHLKSLIKSVERATNRHKMHQAYISLRHMQLYVTLVNVVNRYVTFSSKIYSISVCIGAGYAAIAHFGDYPVFGVMYYIILIEDSCIYTVCYDKAFRIPELFQAVAQQAVFQLRDDRYCSNRGILKRQMRSVPRIGIKVGDFHVLERQSTPIFLRYVLSNIVSMLVAYRH